MKKLITILIALLLVGFGCSNIDNSSDIGTELSVAKLEKNIDGKKVSIEYTDDNTNEGLIIRASDNEIMSFAGNIVVLFSVYNTGVDQNVELAFSFGKDYDLQLSEYNGETSEEILIFSALEATVSTTARKAIYHTVTTTKWKSLSKKDFTDKQIERKEMKDKKTLKENTTFIKSGETKFFKAVIKYAPTGREEFIIEAFGDYDYGHLL